MISRFFSYFVAGAGALVAGAGAPGAIGAGAPGTGALPPTLERTEDRGLDCMREMVIARTEKATKDQVVIFSKTVVAPRAPKVVWEEEAPNALATSAPLPC